MTTIFRTTKDSFALLALYTEKSLAEVELWSFSSSPMRKALAILKGYWQASTSSSHI